MRVKQPLSSELKGSFKGILLHGIVGAVLGYTLLHPIAVVIYSRTSPDFIDPLPISSAFNPQHAWMAAYFAFIGLVFGFVHGLDRHRNRQLFKKVKQLSLTDSLTGLYNRRFLVQSLCREYERAKRYGSNLSLMMIDIDYFKQFNDVHGHPEGDVLLRIFSDRLRRIARITDFVTRYGGEEFMILMPDTNLEMAANLAERLREDIEAFPFEKRGTQPGGKITVSIGCAQVNKHFDEGVDQLLREVDDCLYRAKESGRNQIWF